MDDVLGEEGEGSVEGLERHHHGEPVQGRGAAGDHRRGVEEDIQDPGQVPPDRVHLRLPHHDPLVHLRVSALSRCRRGNLRRCSSGSGSPPW